MRSPRLPRPWECKRTPKCFCICWKRRRGGSLFRETVANLPGSACGNGLGPWTLRRVFLESQKSLLRVSDAANRIVFVGFNCKDLRRGRSFSLAPIAHEESLHLPHAGLTQLFWKLFGICSSVERL